MNAPNPVPAGARRLALFDLDHTLLDGDSNSLWLAFLAERGCLPEDAGRRQAEFIARYEAGVLDIEDYLAFQLAPLASRPLREWVPLREAFVHERIAPRIAPEARQAVTGHLAEGDCVAIVTATHDFLSSAIGALFGIPVIAPKPEVVDGFATVRIDGTICFRERKPCCVEAWLQARGLSAEDFGRRYFYSDSANDLPLLEAVSHPVLVNPDPRLAAIGRERGWPVRRWRCG